jgi:predicted RNase H-like HicB family nuclease
MENNQLSNSRNSFLEEPHSKNCASTTMKKRDNYLKLVEWSEDDECYVGSVPGWIGKCCHGDDETKVYQALCQIVDEWIEIYKKDGRPLPVATANDQE